MVFWLVIGCPLVVLLVIAYFIDRKSKRVRGHVGRVRPGSGLSNRLNGEAAEQLSMFDAGPSVARHIDGPAAPRHATDRPPTD
jgi:hypothetical protein